MKYTVSMEIAPPRERVAQLLADPAHLPKWLRGLVLGILRRAGRPDNLPPDRCLVSRCPAPRWNFNRCPLSGPAASAALRARRPNRTTRTSPALPGGVRAARAPPVRAFEVRTIRRKQMPDVIHGFSAMRIHPLATPQG